MTQPGGNTAASDTAKSSGNVLTRTLRRVDDFQRRHKALALPYAVVKKYGDDQGGYQSALITYYGFLSLFPLLIVATSIIQIVSRGNDSLKERLTASITSYFPALGDSLTASIQTQSKTGIALIVGLLVTFYGAKGVADAVQQALNHIWAVPRAKRAGFPKAAVRSLALIVFAGAGAMLSALVSGFAAGRGQHVVTRTLLSLLGVSIMFVVLWGVYSYGSSARVKKHVNIAGAALAALGFFVLQLAGSYLIAHQLQNQRGLGAQLAMVLAILFWLYLQAQVFLYAAEVNTVRHYTLWPRSLSGQQLTQADKDAFALYAKRETMHEPTEDVAVAFDGTPHQPQTTPKAKKRSRG